MLLVIFGCQELATGWLVPVAAFARTACVVARKMSRSIHGEAEPLLGEASYGDCEGLECSKVALCAE